MKKIHTNILFVPIYEMYLTSFMSVICYLITFKEDTRIVHPFATTGDYNCSA